MKRILLSFLLIALVGPLSARKKTYTALSPNQKLELTVALDSGVRLSLTHEGTRVLCPSTIAMKLANGLVLGGRKAQVSNVKRRRVVDTIQTHFYKKNTVNECYNEMTLNFDRKYSLIFRIYDDGMAYRFNTKLKGDLIVENETMDLHFEKDYLTYGSHSSLDEAEPGKVMLEETPDTPMPSLNQQYFNNFETIYSIKKLTEQNDKHLFLLPFLVRLDQGKSLCITEVDLEDYPGMYLLSNTQKTNLQANFPPYPKTIKQGGHNALQLIVTDREDYIAKTKGTRSFPWRAFIVTEKDTQLADNDFVYRLAEPSRLGDVSWVRPGKVAWDWWNDWNIYGVDFRAGINNETYMYYIDFAAEHHIEYVILDEGWATNLKADMLDVIPEIDLNMLVDYAKTKKVGIILWAGYYAFERNLEQVVKQYAEMGVKGFKVDFINRDDQLAVDFVYRAATMCAKYKMLLDLHGMYKPTGLNRTYPNVINFEAVYGLEQLKFNVADIVSNEVNLPFIRMVAGSFDYTQGAMQNATKANFRMVYSEPMSQGTRCHQLGMYIVYESPLNMLCDNPSNYEEEKACTEFIAKVPTVWDETKVLAGQLNAYIVTARRKDDKWYIGGLNN
ncbi:MAG: glycoside hydrolase family 97 protein, partial [Massilibacteroides sp.]|nr:glycoside hydrolase family 97 protein [Massilibacteroides sp.]